jgi:hypothetical protein
MSQLAIDITILLTFFMLWAVASQLYESWTDPRNRRRRKRKARRKALRRELERQGRLLR